jgi:polysaccharide biosynthesis PFTS motif protein
MLAKFIRLHLRAKLRDQLRGYTRLGNDGRIGLVRDLKAMLVASPLDDAAFGASFWLFGGSSTKAELVVRQYILDRYVGRAMTRDLMRAMGAGCSMSSALPSEWRQEVEKYLAKSGVTFDTFRSAWRWRWQILIKYLFGVAEIARLLLQVTKTLSKDRPLGPYSWLHGLTASNLPVKGSSYDVCSWYANWRGRPKEVLLICHDVPGPARAFGKVRVECHTSPYLQIRSVFGLIDLATWSLLAIVWAGLGLLRGRWVDAMMLPEAARARAFVLGGNAALAMDYAFYFSGGKYRPMWTREAELMGARVLLYFYSIAEQPKLPKGYATQKQEYSAADWPNWIVWDEHQREQLKRYLDEEQNIEVAGAIGFTALLDDEDVIPKGGVAVFDIEAHRLSLHLPESTIAEYLIANTNLHARFLDDIYTALNEVGLVMVFKRKRDTKQYARKSYLMKLRELANLKGVVMLPPAIPPPALIKFSQAVISMPFTSTALYLREQALPTIYYDPTGWIQKDDRAAHGIPILSGIDELRSWLKSTLGCSCKPDSNA